MGIGPSYAIPKILEKTGLSQSDIDVFEINEAFASMVSKQYKRIIGRRKSDLDRRCIVRRSSA